MTCSEDTLTRKGTEKMLTLERAKELNDAVVTEEHLRLHAKNVMAAMGAMAEHFGEDKEHWMAVGYLHGYDYEQDPEDVRAILAHGYGLINDVEPLTNCRFGNLQRKLLLYP